MVNLENKYLKGNLKFAIIGHIEWINFLKVDVLPKPGIISHAKKSLEFPAGGGALIAKTLFELTNNEIHFFTSLGKDYFGEKSFEFFDNLGIKLHIAWRSESTRKGFSLIDNQGERSITIIGKRLAPSSNDNLDWNILSKMDGIFMTAGDSRLLKICRNANILCTTPRVGIELINESKINLDALIGSNLDPDESFLSTDLIKKPKFIIKTEGENGGIYIPGGRFSAINNNKPIIDSYGCGDSFAAGVLYGLAANWPIENSIKLGTVLGRNCIEHFGPYPNMNKIIA
tara:strand:+ start:97 stop:954 length:858 start_codon:yes stop_codon:yes gene_type:complete